MKFGGVVLCGGRSSRMGRPKALLPFGPETLLQRVVRIMSAAVDPIVVVAAVGQELPPLPTGVRIVRDEQEYAGPLAGMGLGLRALAAEADAAFVSACDAPLLRVEFVRHMLDAVEKNDAVVPHDGTFYHPLAGVYRTSLHLQIAALVASGQARPLFLIESVQTVRMGLDDLRVVDGALDSLRNLNTPEEYLAALRDSGISAEPH